MKKKYLQLFVFVWLLSPLFLLAKGPGNEEENIAAANDKIKMAAENSRVMEMAFQLTDVSGPRLTISPGFTRAAKWAKDELSSFGLQNARLEPWGEFGKGWQQEKCYVAMTAPYYAPFIAIPKAWTGSTPGKKEIEANVVLIDAADSAVFSQTYAGKLQGKIVMIAVQDTLHPSFKGDASRYSEAELDKMANAEPAAERTYNQDVETRRRLRAYAAARKLNELVNREKPALILAYGRGTDGTVFVQQGGSQVLGTDEPPATVAISSDDYLRMQRLIRAGIPVKVAAEVRTKTYVDDTQGYNVLAEIPGTDPLLKDEVVMAGAHLDSWQANTGATDNAAGCAIMMEAVRLIKASGLQPRRTIRIALWSGEEQGLLGSKNWVKNHLSSTGLPAENQKVTAYFNLDNGSGRIRGIYCQGNFGVMPIFQQWLDNFGDPLAKTVTINNTGGTDHLSFDAVGVPAFQFIQDELEYDSRTHHTNMDSYDHLVPEDMKQSATIAAAFIFNAAQRDEKLPTKETSKKQVPGE